MATVGRVWRNVLVFSPTHPLPSFQCPPRVLLGAAKERAANFLLQKGLSLKHQSVCVGLMLLPTEKGANNEERAHC